MQTIHTAILDIATTEQAVLNGQKARHAPAALATGDLVLLHPQQTLAKKKLETRLEGPYSVLKQIGTTTTLQSLVSARKFTTHISNLVLYDSSHKEKSPAAVALTDDSFFIVEEVLAHTAKRGRKEPTFHIKWKDYPSEDNTWEPLSNVINNVFVHQYMRDHGMTKLIPKCYQ